MVPMNLLFEGKRSITKFPLHCQVLSSIRQLDFELHGSLSHMGVVLSVVSVDTDCEY